MIPHDMIQQANNDGVILSLTPSGRLRLGGDLEAIARWRPIVWQYQAELIAELSAGAKSRPLLRDRPADHARVSPEQQAFNRAPEIKRTHFSNPTEGE